MLPKLVERIKRHEVQAALLVPAHAEDGCRTCHATTPFEHA